VTKDKELGFGIFQIFFLQKRSILLKCRDFCGPSTNSEMKVLRTSEDDSDRFVFLDTIAGLGRILYLGTKRAIDRGVINIYVAWYIETRALNSKVFFALVH